jgi:hypothetical protein
MKNSSAGGKTVNNQIIIQRYELEIPIFKVCYTPNRRPIPYRRPSDDFEHIVHCYDLYYRRATLFTFDPVRIRARIDPPHPFVCRKRRLNGAVLRMRPEKPRPRVTVGVAR